MCERREKTFLPLILLTLLTIATVCTIPVFADPKPKFYVNPSSIIDPTLTPPKNFTIDINVANITGMAGYEFQIYWKRAVLNCTAAVDTPPAEWTNPFGVGPGLEPDYNATHGRYWRGVSNVPAIPVTGNFTLATLTFQVMGIGSSALDLYETKLSDSSGLPIDHDVEDGYFGNISPAKLYVSPPSIYNATLKPSKNFTVDIRIADAVNLYNFNLKLGFNKTLLEATKAEEGPFLKSFGTTTVNKLEINNTEGYVWISVSLTTGGPASGDGTLANVTFHVLDVGECVLDLYDTELTDDVGGQLPHEVSDGYFNNVLMPRIFVDPPSIIDPELLPPSVFIINISIANITNMYDYIFNLGYNTEILNCLGVYIIPFNGETHFTSTVSVNDAAGIIYVNVTYFDPAEPITTIPPVAFVTIKFQVTGLGTSVFDLYDTHLSDPTGAPISHKSTDGYLAILIRDVAIFSVEPSTNATYVGWLVNITVVAGNEGDIAETFNVSVYYNDNLISTQTVTDLPSGENETLIFTWNTAGVQPCIEYNISAVVSEVPYETDTADNSYIDGKVKIKMLGDINGDGIINIFDVVIMAAAFGSTPGDPNWNPDADLNQDGLIDIFDFIPIAKNFGKKC